MTAPGAMADTGLLPEREALLLLNAGSDSLKCAIFEPEAGMPAQRPAWRGSVSGIGRPDCCWRDSEGNEAAVASATDPDPLLAAFSYLLARALAWLGDQPVRAIGHRLLHAGAATGEPMLLDEAACATLARDCAGAPASQQAALRLAGLLAARWPGVPQVASFDTWFHRTLPLSERMLPLPQRFWQAGLRRDGCHGLSYDYLASVLPRHFGQRARGRVVAAHLGHSASVCGLRRLRSSAVSDGLSGMDGIMTGTGAGLLPPTAVRRLAATVPDAAQLDALLDEHSGLLGVSGASADPALLLRREAAGGPAGMAANAALSLYVRQVVREIAAVAAVLGGLDMLVFTGGVGEHQPVLRERICAALAWLGVQCDSQHNARGAGCISSADSRVIVAVEPAREEWTMARDCMLLTAPAAAALAGKA